MNKGVFFVLCTLLGNMIIPSTEVFAESKKINISPIVQVISYYDIYGKRPVMMGWGSASIINNQGIIISNDHVVDDGKGALASAFSICVTKNINEKPSCDYTASLINRDEKLDISILKIDPVDIYGKTVSYGDFKTIEVDYDYVPKTQDETIAIGYPWVGADTISETKGIVSGLSDHNGYKYIKTDTVIAGGNSGGAFVNKEGKLIGIPTFTIGGWGDSSLGYALSIKEAKAFIESNIEKPSIKNKITETIDFNGYRKTIEDINSRFLVQDDIFNVKFPRDYEVFNYEKNKSLEITLRKQKDTGVNLLSIKIEKTPKLETQRKVFYYLESIGFFSKDYQKLLIKNIGGIDFYYAVDKGDLSNGDSYWGKSYRAIMDGYLISIEVQAPLYDEKRNKEVKQEVESVLSGIQLNKTSLQTSPNTFSTNIPNIDITDFSSTIADTGRYRAYFGKNLYEYIDIQLNELMEYNGKGKTADEIYAAQLKDIDVGNKAKVSFKGFDGYITCDSGYGNYTTDEYGKSVETRQCDISIFFPLEKDLNRQNYLSITILSEAAKLQENLDRAIKFLGKNITIHGGDTKVDIPNILANQIQLQFKDLKGQSSAYRNFLKLLIRYGAIENKESFNGSRALKWGEYLDMYSKWIYNFDTKTEGCKNDNYTCRFEKYSVDINREKKTLQNIFQSLDIHYDEYVDASRIGEFEKLFEYSLAGVDIGGWSEANLQDFENMSSEKEYINEQKKINDFNSQIYGTKKILLYDFYTNYSSTFSSKKENHASILDGTIQQVDTKSTKKTSLSNKNNDTYNYQKEMGIINNVDCTKKLSYAGFKQCYKELMVRAEKVQKKYASIPWAADNYFIVLNFADALDQIFNRVDFGLFDTELAKKKDAIVTDGE